MTKKLLGGLFVGSLLCMAVPLSAHHAFAAKYDEKKPVTIKGTVTKVEWMNPHIYFYVDVKEANGSVTSWAAEGGTPNQLYRKGWRRDSLKVGDAITVEGFGAKDVGLHHLNVRNVTLSDGRKVYAGSNDGGPTQ